MSLRSVLLVLLSREPNTGYGVGRLLNRECHHLWDARLQQIYGEFAKLQEEGLVKAEAIAMPNRPAKKVYSLTPAGEEALHDWLSKPPALHAAKDDLLIQLSCLELIPTGVITRRLEQRRDDSLSEATGLRELILRTPRTDPAQLGRLLTLDAALARAGAEVCWCDKALAVLSAEAAPASRATLAPQPERLRAAR
jgi:DNA-binding PadR family transcriptional regulator